jgi:Methyltransferase domain
VLDLGSGAGAEVLISARRVAPTGKAIGLDMTDEMLDLARTNAREAGVTNVEFVKGYLEDMPLPDASVDVVISNCVINLSGDKPKTIAEAARVLRPGGRLAISDVIADPDMDAQTRADMAAWTGCIAGALTETEFRAILTAAGFDETEIRPTHQVHEHATSAIIRAANQPPPTAADPARRPAAANPPPKPTAAARATPPARAAANDPRRHARRHVTAAPSTTTPRRVTDEIQLNDPQALYRRWRTPSGRRSRSTSTPTGPSGRGWTPTSAGCCCSRSPR